MLALNLAFSRKTEEQEGRKKKCSKALYFSQTCSLQCKGQWPQACFRPSCTSFFFSTAFSDFECLWVTAMSDSESEFPFFFGAFKSENKELHPRRSAGLCVPQCRQQSFTLVTTLASSSSKFISLPHHHGHGHKQRVLWKSMLQLRLYFICYI